MLNKLIALIISINFLFSAGAYAGVQAGNMGEITAADVELLLSKLPEDANAVDCPSIRGKIAVSLLIGGYLYATLGPYFKEQKILKKQQAIEIWLSKKMPREQWSKFGQEHLGEIIKYLRAKKPAAKMRNKAVEESLHFTGVRMFAKTTLFIVAALGIDYIITTAIEGEEKGEAIAHNRVDMARFLRESYKEDPAAFALVVYSIADRKMACEVISEDVSLYKALKEQIEFALSKENEAFTVSAFGTAGKLVGDMKEQNIKEEFKSNFYGWDKSYDFKNFEDIYNLDFMK